MATYRKNAKSQLAESPQLSRRVSFNSIFGSQPDEQEVESGISSPSNRSLVESGDSSEGQGAAMRDQRRDPAVERNRAKDVVKRPMKSVVVINDETNWTFFSVWVPEWKSKFKSVNGSLCMDSHEVVNETLELIEMVAPYIKYFKDKWKCVSKSERN